MGLKPIERTNVKFDEANLLKTKKERKNSHIFEIGRGRTKKN